MVGGAWRSSLCRPGAVALKGQVGGTVPAALSETGSVPIEGAVDGDVSDLRQFAVDLETLGLTGGAGCGRCVRYRVAGA